jgi:hypothetical protein
MLRFHLDPESDLASRRPAIIDASVAWIAERFGVGPGTRVIDLVLLIFCDLCALAPEARARLLRNVRGWLAPDAAFVFEVHSLVTFDKWSASSSHQLSVLTHARGVNQQRRA